MKKVIYGKEAREGLKTGLDILANAVKVTLGAKGRPVAIDRPYTIPLVTQDGVTVAEEVLLEDPLHNMGANMIKSVAKNTDESVGDGTTTATVLTQAIVEEGMKCLDAGISFNEMNKGMEFARDKIIEHLKENSIQIKDDYDKMCAIPTVSSNDPELGKLIADTFKVVGEHGFISVEESKSAKTFVETTKGLKFKMAPESPFMFEDTIRKTSNIKNSKVLLYIGRIETEKEILPALELGGKDHILIVCNEINPLLLSRLVSARLNRQINATIMQCPEYGIHRDNAMEDIALVCGARLFLQEKDDDISLVKLEDLGCAEKIEVTDETTSFINSKTESRVEEKVISLLELYDICEDKQEQHILKERIARLKGGVARIYVGATSELEMKEKKDRIVDAVNALTVAYKDGVVPGGGIALLRASQINFGNKYNKDFKAGIEIIKKAVVSPLEQILKNAGIKNTTKLEKLFGKQSVMDVLLGKKYNTGYNVITEQYADMVKTGILDPLKVTENALRHATSVSSVFLSTECILVDITNYKTKEIKFADGI